VPGFSSPDPRDTYFYSGRSHRRKGAASHTVDMDISLALPSVEEEGLFIRSNDFYLHSRRMKDGRGESAPHG
jgi:hypothetical protein